MKKIVFMTICLSMVLFKVEAQDLIIPKQGNPITAYNLEVSNSFYFYTLDEKAESTLLRIHKDSVLMVRRADGSVLSEESATNQVSSNKQKQTAEQQSAEEKRLEAECKSLKDYDGNVYSLVQIGSQCWMAENLRTTHFANGTEIPMGDRIPSNDSPYRYCPNGSSSNVPSYGYIYNWPAVMNNEGSSDNVPSGVQGICPKGWHVPSNSELDILLDYVKSNDEYQCGDNPKKREKYISKSLVSTKGWNKSSRSCSPGENCQDNNATKFGLMPTGSFYFNFIYGPLSFEYAGFGNYGSLWTATERGKYAYFAHFVYNEPTVLKTYTYKINAYTVRCLRD